MTQLALAVDADDELWTLDDLPTPEAPYVEVEDELIEVRSRFPSSYYTLTGETLPPRIRVRRGIAGTTKASHVQGSTLTPNYGLGSGGGGGAIAVTDGTTTVTEVTSLVAAVVSDEGGGEAAIRQAIISDTDPGAVGAGNLWVRGDPEGYGSTLQMLVRNSGDSDWNKVGISDDLDTGIVEFGVFVPDGTPLASVAVDGGGAGISAYDAGVLNGLIRVEAGYVAIEAKESGVSVGEIVVSDTIEITGPLTVNDAVVLMTALPTADPTVAGQLWNDTGTLKVSAG